MTISVVLLVIVVAVTWWRGDNNNDTHTHTRTIHLPNFVMHNSMLFVRNHCDASIRSDSWCSMRTCCMLHATASALAMLVTSIARKLCGLNTHNTFQFVLSPSRRLSARSVYSPLLLRLFFFLSSSSRFIRVNFLLCNKYDPSIFASFVFLRCDGVFRSHSLSLDLSAYNI